MFARFVFALAGLALIPVLGLCSCSRDRTDEWAISEPTLIADALSISVSAADNRTFPFSTKMKFQGEAWTSLAVNSECRMNAKTFTDSFSLTYRETLDLKSLWPRALTARFPDRDLQRSECDFKFVAANDAGSTHAFEIRGAKLDTFVGREETLGKHGAPISIKADAAFLAAAVDALAESSGSMSDVSLVCGENAVKLRSGLDGSKRESTHERIVHDLSATSALVGRQVCHLVANEPRADTNVFALSAEASLRFTTLALRVSSAPVWPTRFDQTFLEVRIENPNDETAFVSVPDTLPRMRRRHIYLDRNGQFGASATEVVSSVTLSFSGAEPAANGLLSLSPQGLMTIRFKQLPWCGDAILGGPNITGFRWGFESPLMIRQFETPGDSDAVTIYAAPVIENTYSYPASMVEPTSAQRIGPTIPDWIATSSIREPSCI